MTLDEATSIIEQEDLSHAMIHQEDLIPDGVAIKNKGGGWATFATGEQAAIYGEVAEFDNESDALLDFIERLRAAKSVKKYRDQIARRDAGLPPLSDGKTQAAGIRQHQDR